MLLTILSGDPRTIPDKRSALAVGSTISAVLLLFGVVGASAEYRHRTLAPALLVAAGRGRLLVARIVAYGLAGLVIGVIMTGRRVRDRRCRCSPASPDRTSRAATT